MKNNSDLQQLFIDELKDMYSSENQIIDALPTIIKLVSSPDLRDALTKHLHETENQVKRIDRICRYLGVAPRGKKCMGMEGILAEADKTVEGKAKSPFLDAAIIACAQKVEHYEIASYGTLRSFAKQLDFDSDIVDLLQETLDEEGAADKKLTKIAEGSLFNAGVNQEAIAKSRR